MAGRKVLIITSKYTGHGHKSISDALCEQFADMEDVEVELLDGFEFAGKVVIKVGKFYGPLTRTAPPAWKVIWDLTDKHPAALNKLSVMILKKKFLRYIHEIKPDIIVSVHPCFVSSILDILEKENLNIPFITLIADLVSISSTWLDNRAAYTLCPTDECCDIALKSGISQEKIKRVSFPVRKRFTGGNTAGSFNYTNNNIPAFLIMSGGEGSGNLMRLARTLLLRYDCYVNILTGRNAKMRQKLQKWKRKNRNNRLKIYGFLENVHEIMLASDLGIMRGSPNTVMEAVNCALPVIITEALPGQEAGNPGYFEKNNLAVRSYSIEDMQEIIDSFLKEDGRRLKSIKQSAIEFRDLSAAKNIAEFIKEAANDGR